MTTPFQSSAFGALTPEQRARLLEAISPQRYQVPEVQPIRNILEPARPVLRDRLYNLGVDAFGSDSLGRRRAGSMMDALEVTDPGFMLASDAARDFDQNDVFGGTANTLLAGMGVVPMMRGVIKPAIKLTDIPRPNIVQTLPREIDVADRIGTTGAYRGSPGITSEQGLGGLRKRLRNSLTRGTIGRDWYQNSSESATQLTGGRPGYKDLYSGSVALTSQGAAVPSNQVFGVRGFNQAITGNEIDTGRFPGSARTGIEGMMSGAETELGPKRGPFFEALNVAPGEAAARPTNDLWMARAFDYRTPEGEVWSAGLGEAQHRFMDKEINNLVDWANETKVGGETNWTPEKVQASIWVDTKARFEGTPLEAAAYDFSDDLEKLTANINVESEAARGLNHLVGTQTNPELAQRLQAGQRGLLSTPTGEDLLALEAGALTRPTAEGFGYYKNVSAPTDVVRVLASPSTGSNIIDPASRELVEGIAAAQGLLRGQESVGYNFMRGGTLLERNAAEVNLGRAPLQDEMLTVGNRLDEEFGGAITPVNLDRGVSYLVIDDLKPWAIANDIDPNDPKKLAQGWQNKIREITKNEFDAKPEFGVNSGDLVGSFEGYKPSAYLPALEKPGVTESLSRGLQQAAPRFEGVDAQLVREFPDIGVRNQILMRTRQALAEGGIPLVRQLVDQGVLPVAVIGALGGVVGARQYSSQANGQTDAI